MVSGVALLTGLSIVKEILSNRALSASLDAAVDALKEGRGMADAMISRCHVSAAGPADAEGW